MDIKFKCECGQPLKVGEEMAGKVGKCPFCGKQVHVPIILEAEPEDVPVAIAFAQPTAESTLKKPPARLVAKPGSVPIKVETHQTKPAAGLRTRRGVRVRARGAEEEEEEFESPADKKMKQLIIAGVIVGIALIALLVWYFASYKPVAEQERRIQEYQEKALEFSTDLAEFCDSYAGKETPSNAAKFQGKVNALKEKFEQGPRAVTEGHPGMRKYSYKSMQTVLKKLDDALELVQERAQTPEPGKEKLDKINSDFQAIIKECGEFTPRIEKEAKSLRER
jgi:hypothetical protein